jgi:hypothetical protein
MIDTLHNWHQLIKEKDTKNIGSILTEDVVMHSPVVHTPVRGKHIVTLYLMAAFHTLANDKFTYVRELSNASTAILEFTTEIDGIFVNGVDIISWNAEGLIVDFKVMVRPLQAVNLIHQKMGEMLNKLK